MFLKEVVVQNQVGLHARPATFFIQKANEYKSSIWVEKDERKVNAKNAFLTNALFILFVFSWLFCFFCACGINHAKCILRGEDKEKKWFVYAGKANSLLCFTAHLYCLTWKPQIFFVSVVEINCIFAPIVAQMLLN